MSRSDGHEAPCRTHRRGGCLGLLLWVFATLCACAAASPKRVLILTPYGRDAAPFSSAIASFRSVLGRELGEPLDLYEIPLDLARLSDSEGEGPLVAFLEGRIKSQPVDLVVPVGGTSVQFVARHRERLFPDAPVVAVAADPRLVPPGLLQSKATLVTQAVHLPGMVEDILQLCPETTNIVVVAGASALERFWVAECRREFQAFTNRVGFTWLNELPLEDVVARCAVLPPRSFVLHTLFVVDANGIACEKSEALRRLHQGAQAPLFGYFASELGLGTIGGRLYQDSDLGARAARAAIRILQGADPASIPPQILEAAAPVYDGRELRRWGVSESRLSPGSTVRFREPGFWERYRWPLAGTALFVLLQSALIVGLLVNRSRRRQGEMEASLMAEISSKFVNLPAAEIDREIQDAERRICALLGLDLAGLWQWADEAGGTFTLTHLYRVEDGPQPPEPMTARDHFPWCEQQMLAGRTIAVSRMEELPPEAARDREVYRHFGIKSVVAVPLSVGGRSPVGILGFCTTRAEREWPDALVKRLQLVAQIFANALARKRADQTLRDSEFRLNLAVDSAEAGLWALEVGTQTFWASEKARLIFGYAPHEVISMERFQASVHPEDWTRVQQSIAAALQAGAPVNMEYRIRLGDGCEQWITSRGRPVFQSTGEPERLLGLSLDVTERKRTEEALRTSEARLVAGTELAGLGYYEVDYGQGTCFLDDRFRDICGRGLAPWSSGATMCIPTTGS